MTNKDLSRISIPKQRISEAELIVVRAADYVGNRINCECVGDQRSGRVQYFNHNNQPGNYTISHLNNQSYLLHIMNIITKSAS